MTSNLLSHINTILEATGTVPYSIDKLTINDVLSMRDYAIGVEHLVNSLTLLSNHPNKIAYLEADSEEYTNILYRASSSKGYNPFLLTPGERVAQGVSNISTRLISDILPSWRSIPKRNNSIICTNDYYETLEYVSYGLRRKGVVYIVIPPNDARITISPGIDFWYTFKYLSKETGLRSLDLTSNSLQVFFGFFYYIVDRDLISDVSPEWPAELLKIKKKTQVSSSKYTKMAEKLFLSGNKSAILRVFNAVDQALSNKGFRDAAERIYDTYAGTKPQAAMGHYIINKKSTNSSISIIDILDDLYNPEKNGFNSILYSQFVEKNFPNCEMWTDKPCIFVEVGNVKFLTQLYHKLRG